MKKRRWIIYSLSDPRTRAVRYVGVTFRGKARFNEHMSRAINGGKTHRDCWIRSLVTNGLKPEYSELEVGAGDGWQDRERHWIALHRESLTNHTDGGEGAPGYVPTPELRAKWSAMRKGVPYSPERHPAMLGRRHTPESVEKIRAASTGRKMPDSMRAKTSARRKGQPLSLEQKEKLAASHRGKTLTAEHRAKIAASTKSRKPVLCVETSHVFASVTETARTLGVNKASVYQAIRKGCRCKGNHYRFA
ncbi:MAG TPA: hypothetical protein PLS24_09550 [Sedimentisphaerales bacterium]|nr:hypothetical protein [Sedimentisphaerales bacterium]